MQPQVKINNVDISSTIARNTLKVDKFISSNLNTFNTCQFETIETNNILFQSYSDTFSRLTRGSPSLGSVELGGLAWVPQASSIWAIKDEKAIVDSDGTKTYGNIATLTTAYSNLLNISADVTFSGSPPNLFVQDSFDKPDYTWPAYTSGVIITPDIGPAYFVGYYTDLAIVSHQLAGNCFYLYQTMPSPNYVVKAHWVSGDGNAIQFRVHDGGTETNAGGYVIRQGAGSIDLDYSDGTVLIHQGYVGAITSHDVEVRCNGDKIDIFIDNTLFYAITGAINSTTGTMAGFADWSCGAGCVVDSFQILDGVANSRAGVVFGYTDDDNFWAWLGNRDKGVELLRYVSGVESVLWSDSNPIYGSGNYKVRVYDDDYSLYFNGALLHIYNDSAPLGHAKHGMWIARGLILGDFTIDNFVITRFTTLAPTVEIAYVRDTFSRLDNYTLPSGMFYTLGNLEIPPIPWLVSPGSAWEVTSGKAKVHSASGMVTGDVAYVAVGKNVDIAVQADLDVSMGTAQIGIIFGMVDLTHYYLIQISSGTGDLNLFQVSGSTFTAVGTDTTTVTGTVAGTLKAIVHSGLCAIYWNGAATTITAAAVTMDATVINYAGFWSNSGFSILGTYDNFLASGYYADQLTPLEYKEIIITDLDTTTRLFGGLVAYQESFEVGNGPIIHRRIECWPWEVLLEKTVINVDYTDKDDSYIITNLMSTYFPSSYFTTSAVTTVEHIDGIFPVYHDTILNAIQRLCNITGATFYIDDNRIAHYFKGDEGLSASFSFNQVDGISSNYASVRYAKVTKTASDLRGLANRVQVIGGVDGVENYVETISTGSSTPLTSHQLIYDNITNISSFNTFVTASSLTIPIPWTYKDQADPRKTPVEPGDTDPISGSLDWKFFSGLGASSSYTSGSSPGQKIVIFQTSSESGFLYRAVAYHFESGFHYSIDYTDGRVTIKKGATTGSSSTTYDVNTDTSSIFSSSEGVLFIGEGWPAVVDAVTGLISYCPTVSGTNLGTYIGPVNGRQNIVTYSASRNYVAVATDSTSRAKYGGNGIGGGDWVSGNRWFDLAIKNDKLTNITSIVAAGHAYLEQHNKGVQSLEISTDYANGLIPGQKVAVTATNRGVNATYLVNKIAATYDGPTRSKGMLDCRIAYQISLGVYNPQEIDLFASLASQKDNTQDEPDSTVQITVTTDYPS